MQESPESAFIMLFSLLNSKLTKKVDGQLSIHGISFTEYLIMHHLSNSPNKVMPRIQLAECIGITASGVTRLLSPMEKNKLVEKEANPRDARMSLVKLSKTGERLYEEASVGFEQAAKSATDSLTGAQLDKLLRYLNML